MAEAFLPLSITLHENVECATRRSEDLVTRAFVSRCVCVCACVGVRACEELERDRDSERATNGVAGHEYVTAR